MKKALLIVMILNAYFVASQENAPKQTSKEFQEELNRDYADSTKSPLTEADLKVFKELDFFPINEKFIVKAQFKRTKKAKVFKMKTSTSRTPEYKKYGELYFTIDGKEYQLNVYQSIDLSKKEEYKDYLFLPFSDFTNGKESYIGGRYIDMKIQDAKVWEIDFNKAYNPYCAYNHKYSCPIVPLENDLDVAILAGVKKFHD
ncbi:DUF1684 domain-containing protein [Flavobacterium sp.]|uniref:DUF1684 domain-containing protein n=1 Tax=Flavobacterium sp. TaxID=239 RepID=UPI002B4AC8AE|nr:DUF1684 domain-containing protein [Flavobacterium sp.]HLP64848.1 DUF1684 domain-containing protein [Flavobacterium sp.]